MRWICQIVDERSTKCCKSPFIHTALPAELHPINSDDCSDTSCKHSFPGSGLLYLNSWIWWRWFTLNDKAQNRFCVSKIFSAVDWTDGGKYWHMKTKIIIIHPFVCGHNKYSLRIAQKYKTVLYTHLSKHNEMFKFLSEQGWQHEKCCFKINSWNIRCDTQTNM